jgi:hydrogenase-4 component B
LESILLTDHLFLLFFLSLLLAAIAACWAGERSPLRKLVPVLLSGALLLGLVLAAGAFLSGKTIQLDFSGHLPFAFAFTLDRLSGFFLLLICALALPAVLFSVSYAEHYSRAAWRWYWCLLPLFILSMAAVVASSSVFAFMLGWELMTLLSAGLVLIEGDDDDRRRSLFIYLAMMHAGAAAVFASFLLFVPHAPSLTFAGMRAAGGGLPAQLRTIIFLLGLAGFGMKAGIVPLHIWLPKAHPIAPSPVSALMSGVMLKTAVYGFIRLTFDLLASPPAWWGYLVLGIGLVTALLGILYALAEHTLKRLLAYSSVENIGLIYVALGLAVIFQGHGLSGFAVLALIAALFHSLNHGLFKGLLFLGAGAIHHSTHTLDMEELGGLQRRLPAVGVSFLAGSAAIAGLPLLNGFPGEWLIFVSLLKGPSLQAVVHFPALPLLIGVIALVSGLACACYVNVYAITFLGRPRSDEAAQAASTPRSMNISLLALAAACLVLGIFPGIALRPIFLVAGSLIPAAAMPSDVALISRAMPFVAAAVSMVVVLALLLTRRRPARSVETWACGAPGLTARMQYTATSFSKPLRFVFRSVYKPDRKLEIAPAGQPYFPASIAYRSVRTTSFEKSLYRPAVDLVITVAQQLRRLHTGNIQVYLLYIFLMILSLLLVLRFA